MPPWWSKKTPHLSLPPGSLSLPSGAPLPSPPGSPPVQQAVPVNAAQMAAIAAALAFLEQPVPENADPSEAKKLKKMLDAAGLDCKTKESCVPVPADYAEKHIAKLRNLAQLYRRYVTSIERQEDYPPLYLRYDIPDQAVVPLVWMMDQMSKGFVKSALPQTLSKSKYATMPGFAVVADGQEDKLLVSPDTWIFRFRPLGNPAPHPGPFEYGKDEPLWDPHAAKPGPGPKWEIHGSSDLVDMDGKPSKYPRGFGDLFLSPEDPRPDRALWAYVQLAKDCEYETVLSWGKDHLDRAVWEKWVHDEATRNEKPF